jgi:hypothetical protein
MAARILGPAAEPAVNARSARPVDRGVGPSGDQRSRKPPCSRLFDPSEESSGGRQRLGGLAKVAMARKLAVRL